MKKTRLVAFEDSRNGNYEFRYLFLALLHVFKNIPNPMKPSHGERPGNLRGTIFVGNP